MELQGKIIEALPVKTGTSARGEWKVQEFVLETFDDRFSRKMVFSVFGEDRLQRFNIQVGQQVLVSFDIDAHEYQGRWFNSIRAFDVRPVLADVQQPPVAGGPGVAPFDQSLPPLHSLLPRLHNRLLNRPPQLLHSSQTPSHKKQAPTTCHSKGVNKFVYKQEVQRKMNLCTSVF